jgi:hypothetical protein
MFKVESEATMKFSISRTTDLKGYKDEPPSKRSILEAQKTVAQPWSGTRGDVPEHYLAAWLSDGQSHRIENGIHVRDMTQRYWSIEINSLEELIELIGEVGHIVVTEVSIEIYDDYRE